MNGRYVPVDIAMDAAERTSTRLLDVLMVLSMALGFETEGLDAEERSGVETVVGEAHVMAKRCVNDVTEARAALRKLLPEIEA